MAIVHIDQFASGSDGNVQYRCNVTGLRFLRSWPRVRIVLAGLAGDSSFLILAREDDCEFF